MIELLKEARGILNDCYYEGKESLSKGTRNVVAKVIARIDTELAKPAPHAVEIVMEVHILPIKRPPH